MAAIVVALVVPLAALFTGSGFVVSFRFFNAVVVVAAMGAFTASR